VGYDRKQKLLEIEFQNGAVYQYEQVPPRVARSLAESPSAGRFFHQNIRKGYECSRVDLEKPAEAPESPQDPQEASETPGPRVIRQTSIVKASSGSAE